MSTSNLKIISFVPLDEVEIFFVEVEVSENKSEHIYLGLGGGKFELSENGGWVKQFNECAGCVTVIETN